METKVMSAAIRHRIIRVLEAKTQMDLWALLVSLDPPAWHSPAGYVSPAAQPPSTSVGHQQLGGQ